jgi:excisionase family DNA binding protein
MSQTDTAAQIQTTPLPRLLTAKAAGDYIARSEQAIRHMIFQRDIPTVRSGRCVRIDRKDLDAWVENNKG